VSGGSCGARTSPVRPAEVAREDAPRLHHRLDAVAMLAQQQPQGQRQREHRADGEGDDQVAGIGLLEPERRAAAISAARR
jgi:hypothetical protein